MITVQRDDTILFIKTYHELFFFSFKIIYPLGNALGLIYILKCSKFHGS